MKETRLPDVSKETSRRRNWRKAWLMGAPTVDLKSD